MSSFTTIRGAVAEGADGERLSHLASLAGSDPPQGLVLLAEVQGRPIAAIGIFDGRALFAPGRSTFALQMRLRLLRLPLRLFLPVYGI